MKKTLLLITLFTAYLAFAQQNRVNYNKPVLPARPMLEEAGPQAGVPPGVQKKNINSIQAACNGNVFTYGINAFGVAGSYNTYRQNCVNYNSDLNRVLWINRRSFHYQSPGLNSGAVQATWLDVATGVWDSMILYRDSSQMFGARYPGGLLFNPVGNTNISNAYVVGTGPTTNGSNWNGTWYSSRQITGAYHTVTSAQDQNAVAINGAPPFGSTFSTGGSQAFLNADIQQSGNNIYVGGGLVDNTMATGNDQIGGTIGKANNLTWNRDTILPGFYIGPNTGYSNDAQGLRLAFSPNGQIGYAVFMGRLATNFGTSADSTLMPIVYKTTNGGVLWSTSPILPGFDWNTGHPELLKNVGLLRSANPRFFTFYLRHGIDLTVDSLGTLHLVGTLTDPFIGAGSVPTIDSLTYGWTYHWDYATHHPVIWDLMTDGTNWDALMVDSIMTGEVGDDPSLDTTSNWNPWTNGSAYINYGARVQVSRSVTGGKIFYAWAESDTSVTHTLINIAPDIHMKSYDISNQLVTKDTNITQGLGNCYFHFMSDVSYFDNSQGAWVSPIVYTTDFVNQIPPYNSLGNMNHHYLGCPIFTSAQYTDSASVYKTLSGVGIGSRSLAIRVVNYPNPFSQTTTFSVELKKAQAIQIRVYNVLGDLVYEQRQDGKTGKNQLRFDGAGLNAGVYHYTVQCNEGRASGKMILQK